MAYNPDLHHRKSIRLKEYDYSQNGVCFITICVQNRECLLGSIIDGKMILNDAGKMVDTWWKKLFEKFPDIIIDEYVIMPNHIHGIIQIINNNTVGAIPCNRPDTNMNTVANRNKGENMVSPLRVNNTYNGLGQYVSWFKRMSTNEYIRNEESLEKIREYIINNPLNWEKDELYS